MTFQWLIIVRNKLPATFFVPTSNNHFNMETPPKFFNLWSAHIMSRATWIGNINYCSCALSFTMLENAFMTRASGESIVKIWWHACTMCLAVVLTFHGICFAAYIALSTHFFCVNLCISQTNGAVRNTCTAYILMKYSCALSTCSFWPNHDEKVFHLVC